MRALLAVLLLAGAARAQTMLDQEDRLIEIHSLLIALQPDAPGVLQPRQLSLGLELITIPKIDGTTGSRHQITASDRTPLFPRPRLQLGLPAFGDFRPWAGLSYIPPLQINGVSSHLGALELGLAWDRGSPLVVALRAYGVAAESKSPVTDPATRDTLDTTLLGADVSAAYRVPLGFATLSPFAAVGVQRVAGDFTVTSDNALLTYRTTDLGVNGGVRFAWKQLAAMGELVVYPGRMTHPVFSVAWLPSF